MESIYIGISTFVECQHAIENNEDIIKQYPDDPSLKIGLDSLKQFRKQMIVELERRVKEDKDEQAKAVLTWVNNNFLFNATKALYYNEKEKIQ